MHKYDPDKFFDALVSKIPDGGENLKCAICGSGDLSTEALYANVFVDEKIGEGSLSNSIPTGIMVCQNCGYMHLFVLKTLGAL